MSLLKLEEKRLQQKDKLAKLPAIVLGYHLPPDKNSADYPAMVLLNSILEGDEGSLLYQRLVKEKQLESRLEWFHLLGIGK